MANAPKNRLEIQIVWPGGRWCIKGPVRGRDWSHAVLIAELERALVMVKSLAASAPEAKEEPPSCVTR